MSGLASKPPQLGDAVGSSSYLPHRPSLQLGLTFIVMTPAIWRAGATLWLASLLGLTFAIEAPSPAYIYMHPSATGQGIPAKISAVQANRVLAHMLDVPGETLGFSANHKNAWDWLEPRQDGKQATQSLFERYSQREVVLITGITSEDAQDIFPSRIRNTHTLESPPHISSFEALLNSYGERIHSILPAISGQFGGFFTSTAEALETALEGAADWLLGGTASGGKTWATLMDESHVDGEASAKFYRNMNNLVAFFDKEAQEGDELTASPRTYQIVRLNGLDEIKAAYGTESDECRRAKGILKSFLQGLIEKVDSSNGKSHKLAFITLPEQQATLAPRSLDVLSPFRSSLAFTPFLKTRDDLSSLKKNNGSKMPKESDYVGKCFTKEDDLNQATLNCSGHGKAIQSTKGGRKCYRCQCQKSKEKGGKSITWAGAACQKQDISQPFVLLLITTIGLIFISLGSVLYLFMEGQRELPSVLAGISIPNK